MNLLGVSMSKLKMMSPDLTAQNIDKIAELFPAVVTEVAVTDELGNQLRDDAGNLLLRKAIDFDLLKQELSSTVVEGPVERYQLDWPGKRESLLAANAPIAKTLRPAPEESVEFDTTENLFIEGDNLEALKLLQESYLGKVKMIYIDPPYNMRKDPKNLIYKDNFAGSSDEYLERSMQKDGEGNRLVANTESNGRFHSDWLSMMHSRLRLTRNLLTDDGVIFISIDDNEQANLKRLCDEVFGEQNFIANIIWRKKYGLQNDAKYLSNSHDYILMYAKIKNSFKINLLPRTEEQNSRYKNLDNDPRGPWKTGDLSVARLTEKDRYEIVTPSGRKVYPPEGRSWSVSKNKFEELVEDNRIWFGRMGKNVPSLKQFLSEVKDGVTVSTFWDYTEVGHTDGSNKYLKQLFDGLSMFNYPKTVELLKRITHISTGDNDIILDFFAGSSTTAHAVMQLNAEDGGNRKFIMVQLPEATDEKSEAYKAGYKNIAEISKERIRRAGKQILESDEIHEDWNRDIGFRVFKIDSSNMKDVYYQPESLTQVDLLEQVDNIKEDRTPEDLLFQVMLDWGLELSLPIKTEEIEGKKVFSVADDALIACFDTGITESLVKTLAERAPLRILFCDNHYLDNDTKINAEQLVKQIAPNTELKSI